MFDDAVIGVIGSMPFVLVHIALFAAWIVVNTGAPTGRVALHHVTDGCRTAT